MEVVWTVLSKTDKPKCQEVDGVRVLGDTQNVNQCLLRANRGNLSDSPFQLRSYFKDSPRQFNYFTQQIYSYV